MDAAFWALDLKYPTSVEAVQVEGGNEYSAPKGAVVKYQFPARGAMPPVTLFWYEGICKPPRPKELPAETKMPIGGQLVVGEKYSVMDGGDYCASPRIIPEEKMRVFERPPKTIPRVPEGSPYIEWINACKGGVLPGSQFDYAGPLTEMVLLGNLAIRMGGRVEWDGEAMRSPNRPETAKLVSKHYRVF
jgi:hypothetical protein